MKIQKPYRGHDENKRQSQKWTAVSSVPLVSLESIFFIGMMSQRPLRRREGGLKTAIRGAETEGLRGSSMAVERASEAGKGGLIGSQR